MDLYRGFCLGHWGTTAFGHRIIGEYIGKIYMETKARPKFIVQEYLSDEKQPGGFSRLFFIKFQRGQAQSG